MAWSLHHDTYFLPVFFSDEEKTLKLTNRRDQLEERDVAF